MVAFAALCFMAASTTVRAQAPPNDHCEDVTPMALAVGSSIEFTGNNEGATTDGDYAPGSLLDGFGPSVWVAFTTSECSNVTITYCGSTAPFYTDYYWNVITPQCPANELVVTQDYNNGECADGQPTVHFSELAAGTYYYPVWSDVGTSIGDYVISVSATACATSGPANDLCSGAQPHGLSIDDVVTITGDNTGATDSEGLGYANVWEAITIAECATVTVNYCNTDLIFNDFTMGIYADCPATQLIPATAADTCVNGNMLLTFEELTPGTYYIPVLMDPTNAEGEYSIRVRAVACAITEGPVNDLCSNVLPQVLAVGDALSLVGDNTGATDSEGLGYANVWEAITITECANLNLDYCSTDEAFTDFAFGIYSDCPATQLIQPSSIDACASGSPIQTFAQLAPGTYWIPVLMDPDNAVGVYTIRARAAECEVVLTPVNDLCADASNITVVAPDSCASGAVIGDNLNSTGSGNMPTCADAGQHWQDVWYTFDAEDADEVTITLEAGTIVGAGLEVFAGCDDISLACSISGEPIVLPVLSGSTYHVRVFTQDDGTPGAFVLCVTADNTTRVSSMERGTFNLYPNPSTGDINFVPSVSWTDARIAVLDMTGRTVYVEQANLKAGEAYQLFLAGTLKAGSYLLQVTSSEGSSMVKLMVK